MTHPDGRRYVDRFVVDEALVRAFAALSGDNNPIHVDAEEARSFGYSRPVAHGALLVAAISRVIGTRLPGPGAVWIQQVMNWLRPVFVGDEVELVVEVTAMSEGAGLLSLKMTAAVKDVLVMAGTGQVKISKRLSGKHVGATNMRVALVTGGSRGIGRAIARQLATNGITVAINYRSRDADAELALEEIKTLSGGSIVRADLGTPGEAARVVRDVIARHGRVDVIVHCATPPVRRVNIDQAVYADVCGYLAVYLGAVMEMVAEAAPGMSERHFGRFILLGTSYMFGIPPVGMAAYIASKEAVWGYAKSLAGELGARGITTNLVSPGLTVTELVEDVPARAKEIEARRSSLRRLATVEDTAAAVAFLASESGGYINGVNLPLTGGTV